MNINELRGRLKEHCKKAGGVKQLHEKLNAIGIQAPCMATIYQLMNSSGSAVTLSLLVNVCDHEFNDQVNQFAPNKKTVHFKYSGYYFVAK